MVQQIKPGCDVEVDGGIDAATAPLAVRAGANVLVAGSSIFAEAEGVAAAMERLRNAINQGSEVTIASKILCSKRSYICSLE
jgi:ribulose-phosphate 3-epimerase